MTRPIQTTTTPYSPDAEHAVLGAILLNPDAWPVVLAEFAGHDHGELFHGADSAATWAIFRDIAAKGLPIDSTCVITEIMQRPECSVNATFVAGLLRDVPTSANAAHYARIVVEMYRRRKLQDLGHKLFHSPRANVDSSRMMIDIAHTIASVSRGGTAQTVTVADGLEFTIERITNLFESRSTGGLLTGFRNLDNIINGLDAGTVCVLAARPSVGKTALALNVAANAAKAGKRVLIFTLEMAPAALNERMVYSAGGIEKRRVIDGYYSRDVLIQKLQAAAAQTFFRNIHIHDARRLTHFDLTTKAKAFKQDHPLDLIIVDYLQLLSPANPRAPRESQVAEASREIKILAEQAGCPVLLLSQFSRAAEQDGEPMLSHLRESGAIEQDADVAILLSRADDNVVRCNVAKNRNGATGTTGLVFDRDTQTFRDWVGSVPASNTTGRRGFQRTKPTPPPAEANYDDGDDVF